MTHVSRRPTGPKRFDLYREDPATDWISETDSVGQRTMIRGNA
jgi:hypothetical protein